jgi:hypothetical protein
LVSNELSYNKLAYEFDKLGIVALQKHMPAKIHAFTMGVPGAEPPNG